MKLSQELKWRGFVNQTTYKDLEILDRDPITFYWGVDPSSDSMTIGNLAAAMMVKAFIKHGHHPVLLIGGATGLIGDPDGKTEERALKSLEEIAANKEALVGQYKQIFGDHQFVLVDNYDWFNEMRYLQFLRDIGKHVPMRQMLGRDFVQKRLGDGGKGISYAEFSYVLIQAYDFLHLYNEHKVTLQVCGSDQWGNCIAGVDLVRREASAEVNVFSTPLVVNKSTGMKFGKTESGAIWLDPAKTSPSDFYQFWINVDDDSVEGYLKLYTELEQPEIDDTMEKFNTDRSTRFAQKRLALEVTKLVHGVDKADQASKYAQDLAKRDFSTDSAKALTATEDSNVVDVLVDSGLSSSKTEARQLLTDGGVYVNDKPLDREKFQKNDFVNGSLSLRRGKKLSNSVQVLLKESK